MKSFAVSKLSTLGGLALFLALGVGCGGQTGGSSSGTGGAGGNGGGRASRDAGRDSSGTNQTDARSDAASSGGARGGAGGAATGGAAGAGNGGVGGSKEGAGGATGGGGAAQGGASGGRCTVFQFQPSHPCPDQIFVDMDGDGRLDVVSGWGDDSTAFHVTIYRQTAPRVFADPDDHVLAGGLYLNRMAAADLDQDGVPDVAMADGYGNVALMLSGGGAGYSFAPLLRPTAGNNDADSDDIVLADFDGDGYRDIAVPVWYTGPSLGIYWGTGKGAFLGRSDQTLCNYGSRTAVVDANEDGLPDLALGCLQAGGHVLINQGGRSFAPVVLPGGTQSLGLAAGDLNHDGHVDFVMPDRVLKQLIVSLGDGHGNFTVPTGSVAATGSEPDTVAIGDLDGDGNADVILTDQVQQTTIAFYGGTGDGHFRAPRTFPMATASGNLAIGDIDGDGYQDLLVGDGPTIVYGPCP